MLAQWASAGTAVPGFHGRLGFSYAILGGKDEAIREGRRAVELLPISRDAYDGPNLVWWLARTYLLVGERDAAMEQLGTFLSAPSIYLFPLRLDPVWDPIRQDSRFQALVAKYEPLPK